MIIVIYQYYAMGTGFLDDPSLLHGLSLAQYMKGYKKKFLFHIRLFYVVWDHHTFLWVEVKPWRLIFTLPGFMLH